MSKSDFDKRKSNSPSGFLTGGTDVFDRSFDFFIRKNNAIK
jgi:hypothetical protein